MRPSIGLRGFLLLCIVCGTAIGLYVRWHPPQEPDHSVEEALIDGFRLEIVWIHALNGDKRGQFAYLVAHPSGYKSRRYILKPSGIYIDGAPPGSPPRWINRTAGKPDCKYWIFTSSPETGVQPIEGSFTPLTPRDFDDFKKSELWNDYVLPALIEESRRTDDPKS